VTRAGPRVPLNSGQATAQGGLAARVLFMEAAGKLLAEPICWYVDGSRL